MCCYADLKNFNKFNNVIQKIISYSIQFINEILQEDTTDQTEDDEVDVTGLEKRAEPGVSTSEADDTEAKECVSYIFSLTVIITVCFDH